MNLPEAIALIKPGIRSPGQKSTWADLGCGSGLFTTALADCLDAGSCVYAVDVNGQSLEKVGPFPSVELIKIKADFITGQMPFSALHGILMANSLHFVRDKKSFLHKAGDWLRNDGCILLVEYDTDQSNPWVPYPLSFVQATALFEGVGWTIQKTGVHGSRFQRAGMYSALISR